MTKRWQGLFVALLCLGGCADFDASGEAFCAANPVRCGLEAPDAGQPPKPPPVPQGNTPPTIASSNQSATQVSGQDSVSFTVQGHDAESTWLNFVWSANVGTFGVSTDLESKSTVSWKAPACASAGVHAVITVVVTDDGGLKTTGTFDVTVAPCPTTPKGGAGGVGMSL